MNGEIGTAAKDFVFFCIGSGIFGHLQPFGALSLFAVPGRFVLSGIWFGSGDDRVRSGG